MARGVLAAAVFAMYTIAHQVLIVVHQMQTADYEPHSRDDVFVIERLFDDQDARVIRDTLDSKRSSFVRKALPVRMAEALPLRGLYDTPVLKLFRDHATLQTIQNNTGMRLQLVPRSDKNQVNALRYSEIGDGIDPHRDGNVYIGIRWAGIYTVRDDYNSRFLLDGKPVQLQENSLLIFRADLLTHGVSRRTREGERMVINVLLCDVCTPKVDAVSLMYQHVVNELIFY